MTIYSLWTFWENQKKYLVNWIWKYPVLNGYVFYYQDLWAGGFFLVSSLLSATVIAAEFC